MASDISGVMQLAWTVHHNYYHHMTPEAPDGFKQPVNGLASLQSFLQILHKDVNADNSILEKLGEQKKGNLKWFLSSCYDTLKHMDMFLYICGPIGVGDDLQPWRNVRWLTQQRGVPALRAKVTAHIRSISLCMSAIGTLPQLVLGANQASRVSALEHQQQGETRSIPLNQDSVAAETEPPAIDMDETTISAQNSSSPLSIESLAVETTKINAPVEKLSSSFSWADILSEIAGRTWYGYWHLDHHNWTLDARNIRRYFTPD
ncbi:MAG: hypothetical protein M1835_002149 [Candelina submexicana]|nr:MAG: hypothetical protein M1835_002149 [Candelina submexicana]